MLGAAVRGASGAASRGDAGDRGRCSAPAADGLPRSCSAAPARRHRLGRRPRTARCTAREYGWDERFEALVAEHRREVRRPLRSQRRALLDRRARRRARRLGVRGARIATVASCACCWSSRRRAASASGAGWSASASASRRDAAIAGWCCGRRKTCSPRCHLLPCEAGFGGVSSARARRSCRRAALEVPGEICLDAVKLSGVTAQVLLAQFRLDRNDDAHVVGHRGRQAVRHAEVRAPNRRGDLGPAERPPGRAGGRGR